MIRQYVGLDLLDLAIQAGVTIAVAAAATGRVGRPRHVVPKVPRCSVAASPKQSPSPPRPSPKGAAPGTGCDLVRHLDEASRGADQTPARALLLRQCRIERAFGLGVPGSRCHLGSVWTAVTAQVIEHVGNREE